MLTMLEQFKAARRVSTPLIAIRTLDPSATLQSICQALPDDAPKMRWDIVNGCIAVNDAAVKVCNAMYDGQSAPIATGRPNDCLEKLASVPEKSAVFFMNTQNYFGPGSEAVVQGIWNLRDIYKTDKRTFIMLGPDFTFPAELAQDVLILDEPLPDETQLASIVKDTFDAAGLKSPDVKTSTRVVDALRGLAQFPAEQVVSMSLHQVSKDYPLGIDLDAVWERKRRMIENAKGMSVWRGLEKFADIGGVENAKKFFSGIINGEESPRVFVFLDEIEKAMAGAGGDNTGVTQDMLGTLLSYMEDNGVIGSIFLGPPGAAKSMFAKACGNEAGVPTIGFDIGGMKASLVGQSEQQMRNNLKVVSAVGGGKAFFIATCNSIAILPPELQRRFTAGTFFFDLPTVEERAIIWQLYLKKYGVKDDAASVDATDWTGAEIRNCVRMARMMRVSLKDAASYIVPVARSMGDRLLKLRDDAHGKYIDASKIGCFYQSPTRTNVSAGNPRRGISLQGDN
jgi:hypothetical protein